MSNDIEQMINGLGNSPTGLGLTHTDRVAPFSSKRNSNPGHLLLRETARFAGVRVRHWFTKSPRTSWTVTGSIALAVLATGYVAFHNDKTKNSRVSHRQPATTFVAAKTAESPVPSWSRVGLALLPALLDVVPDSSIPNPAPPEPIEEANQRLLDAGDYVANIRARHAAEIKAEGDAKQLPERRHKTGQRKAHAAAHTAD